MQTIRQINNWTIKFDPTYDAWQGEKGAGSYAVFAPDGKRQEDRLTLQQAEDFCRDNLDHVVRPRRANIRA